MSHATYPCRAFEVDESLIAQVCPLQLKRFKEQLERADADYPDWINAWDDPNNMLAPDSITSATWHSVVKYWYVRLVNRFARETGIHISLDRWRADDVVGNNDTPAREDGCFWYASALDVMQYTPAARKIRKHLRELEWVEQG